jgi:chromate transporter
MRNAVEHTVDNTRQIWGLVRSFVALGMQSFGGGATTLYLMRRITVEEQHWVTDEEYSQYWGMVQIAPGINLIGQAVLIGYRVARLRGALAAMCGLLIPSALITLVLTAGYATIRSHHIVIAAVHGIIPATVGVGTVLAIQMLRPALTASRRDGRGMLAVSIAVVLITPVLLGLTALPAVVILWGAGIWCALGAVWIRRGKSV